MNRPNADPQLPSAWPRLTLRRADQAVSAALILISLIAIAAWCGYQTYLGGRTIDIKRAEPIAIDFKIDVNKAEWPELALMPNIGEQLAKRIVADRAEPVSAAAFGFRPVNSFHRHFHQQRHRGQRADGNQRDRRGLPKGMADLISDQHSNPEPERGARERHQTIERNLLGGFRNGYRKRHRIPLYVSFRKRKRENLAARALACRLPFFT